MPITDNLEVDLSLFKTKSLLKNVDFILDLSRRLKMWSQSLPDKNWTPYVSRIVIISSKDTSPT